MRQLGDPDPAIENDNLVTKQAYMQSSIQSLRREMQDQGTAGNAGQDQFMDRKEGVFGGFARVSDGFQRCG